MGDQGDDNYVIALNRADGKPLWTTKIGKAGAPGWGGFAGPRCSPTVDGELVFAVGPVRRGGLRRTPPSGKEVWRKDYVKDFGGTTAGVGL